MATVLGLWKKIYFDQYGVLNDIGFAQFSGGGPELLNDVGAFNAGKNFRSPGITLSQAGCHIRNSQLNLRMIAYSLADPGSVLQSRASMKASAVSSEKAISIWGRREGVHFDPCRRRS